MTRDITAKIRRPDIQVGDVYDGGIVTEREPDMIYTRMISTTRLVTSRYEIDKDEKIELRGFGESYNPKELEAYFKEIGVKK